MDGGWGLGVGWTVELKLNRKKIGGLPPSRYATGRGHITSGIRAVASGGGGGAPPPPVPYFQVCNCPPLRNF